MKFTFFFSLLMAAHLVGAPSKVYRDVAYAGSNNPQQTLDVYSPEGMTNRPMIVWIHGGGWGSGDKTDDMQWKPQSFVERGFVFVSINYRLLFIPSEHPGDPRPAVTLRDMQQDIARAVRWLHDHAATYGGDPKFFFVMGHSAGAQLAALFCTDSSYLKAEGLSFEIIKGCVPVDGDTFYPALQIDTAEPFKAAGWRRKFPDAKAQRELSAVMHVARDKGIPPFLLLHVAGFPETGTKLQSEILAKALEESGVRARLFGAPGRTHITLNSELGRRGDPATETMYEFIDEQVWRDNYAGWSGQRRRSADGKPLPPPAPPPLP